MFFWKRDKSQTPADNTPTAFDGSQDAQGSSKAAPGSVPAGVPEAVEEDSPFSAPFEKPIGFEEDAGSGAIDRLDYPADKPPRDKSAEPPASQKEQAPKGRGFLPPKTPENTPAQQYAKAFGDQGNGVPDPGFDPRNKVLSVFAMLGFFLVMAIPLLNLIMAVRWTFGKKTNRNLRNLSITMLFFFALVLGVYVYLFFVR